MENVSSTAEMYFLFSAESSVIRCPHVQYIIPALQCLRHALHCNFGSTLITSHSSVFPAAIIATFDSALKGLNHGRNQEEVEEGLGQEVKGQNEENNTQTTTCTCMDGMR